jgi:uncharacterized protein (TIRG00374 family)
MSQRLKAFFQYFFIFGIAAFLVWFSLRGLHVDDLHHHWQQADKSWLIIMAVIALLSHLARAERWRMLMASAGYQTKLSYSFYSLMVGYLVNLIIPRGGEVSRCYNLHKLDKTPPDVSFGTVVVERIVDLMCLLILISICFLVESKKLISFLQTLPFDFSDTYSKIKFFLICAAVVALVILVVRLLLKKSMRFQGFVTKAWNGFKQGFISVFKLERKGLFIFYSVFIWSLYFLMSYAVLKAFPSTSELGMGAVLSLFAIGSIAMASPLPGGAGSYHLLVPQGLIFLYQVPASDAKGFTVIFHGWQTIIMIVGGVISLLITSYLVKRSVAEVSTERS